MGRRTAETGLTLVEMLVVLAIIGIVSGMAVLGLGAAGGRGAEVEARRLAARLTLATDEAMVTDRMLALDWNRDGYRFVSWDPASRRWLSDRDASWGDQHDLPGGMSLAITPASSPLILSGDGTGAPMDVVIGTAKRRWRIAFDGIGTTVEADRADG